MKKLALYLCLLGLLPSANAFAWGQKGHDIVTSIADCHLTHRARKNIEKLLDGHSIVYYSSWLDNIQNDKRYAEARTWHYANIDRGETYENMPKNPNGDVVSATNMIMGKLRDRNLSDSLRTHYLKYLIHTVADMHCPMHAGRLSDLGGNKYAVKWFGETANLHKVWDSLLIESVRKWSYTEWRRNIDILDSKQREDISRGEPLEWFLETAGIAKEIYDGTPEGANLSYDYSFYNSILLETQLRNAGYRLAKVLNELFG